MSYFSGDNNVYYSNPTERSASWSWPTRASHQELREELAMLHRALKQAEAELAKHAERAKQEAHERSIRKQYPTLDELWEKYQAMLALIDPGSKRKK